MRILFDSQTTVEVLVSMLPLERAARRAGHDTLVVGEEGRTGLVPAGVPVISSALPLTDGRSRTAQPSPLQVQLATQFAPELIVSGPLDLTGRLVASALEIPWMIHDSLATPGPERLAVSEGNAALHFMHRDLVMTPPAAVIDHLPTLLTPRLGHGCPHLPVRPERERDRTPPVENFRRFDGSRKVLLLVMGEPVAHDGEDHPVPELLAAAFEAGVDIVVSRGGFAGTAAVTDAGRVQSVRGVSPVDLVPLADVVLSVGEPGAVLASMASGRAVVSFGLAGNHSPASDVAADLGCCLTIERTQDLASALHRVLTERSFAETAAAAASAIAALPSPTQVLGGLLDLL